jgi:hypothetical protein
MGKGPALNRSACNQRKAAAQSGGRFLPRLHWSGTAQREHAHTAETD